MGFVGISLRTSPAKLLLGFVGFLLLVLLSALTTDQPPPQGKKTPHTEKRHGRR